MSVLTSLWAFILAVGRRWYLLVCGLFFAGITAYQLLGPPNKNLGENAPVVHLPIATFLGIAVAALLLAAFLAYHDLHRQTRQLLRPGPSVPVRQTTTTTKRNYIFGLLSVEQSRTETEFHRTPAEGTEGAE